MQKATFRTRRFRAWMRYHGLNAWMLCGFASVALGVVLEITVCRPLYH